MSPQVFRTRDDSAQDVEIAGVGRLAAFGKGGISVKRAAESRRMEEFLDKDGEPLSGKTLASAAEEFAEARGLVIDNPKNVDEEQLAVEAGAFPTGPTIEDVSRAYGERERAQLGAEELALNPDAEPPEVSAAEASPNQPETPTHKPQEAK